ncbi:prothoracicostatic peptide-like [Mizuhopecten yessoensis]|uniref:Prothoracicostatic peptide n=1 Tax=Mizuhopecten yessoensis TaxID=6573 RepID=A0A210QT49_MIZYE|nr:prothoracicostatic peptide-like [Mizuhopecten yessoensis]OWF51927.1 Prothoracicostatic peptide [Mizuhopecten yessoensis]
MKFQMSITRLLCLTLLVLKTAYCMAKSLDGIDKTTGAVDASREKRGVLNSDSKEEALSKFINTLNASPADESEVAKRGWQKFNSWGKRVLVNLSPWGKRRWARLQSWGKRSIDPSAIDETGKDDIDSEITPEQALLYNEGDKRGWKDMGTWGKRDPTDELTDAGLEDVDKRKWTGYASWGKRDDENVSDDLLPKRKWNQLSAWGKRAEALTADQLEAIKRKWSSMASWGKRSNWSGFNSWGKRNPWSNLATWGKRSKWSGFNSWGKRNAADDLEQ